MIRTLTPRPHPRSVIARQKDSVTSWDAALEHTASGRRDHQCHLVLEALHQFNGVTSAELAAKAGIDRYIVARRLPDLRNVDRVVSGTARRCDVSGRQSLTWWIRDTQTVLPL